MPPIPGVAVAGATSILSSISTMLASFVPRNRSPAISRFSVICGRVSRVGPRSLTAYPVFLIFSDIEYSLVAGGDEAPAPDGTIVKIEDQADDGLISFDHAEDTDSLPSPTSTYSPAHFSPSQFKPETYSPSTWLSFPAGAQHSLPSSPDQAYSASPLSSNSSGLPSPEQRRPFDLTATDSTYSPSWTAQSSVHSPLNRSLAAGCTSSFLNRITNVCLYADGMSPLSIDTDGLLPPSSTAIALKIKLTMPYVNDPRSPSTIQGFVGNIRLASVFTSHARCVTRKYIGGTCVSEEVSPLQVSAIDNGTVIAALPDSPLGRCRWFESSGSCCLIVSFPVLIYYS
jgi:hypothetical protein